MNDFRDYYNYENNNYNIPTYKNKSTFLYDPYQGFIRGNMYSDLYNTYKINSPIEVIPKGNEAELLTRIDMLTFALTDLKLYLDINPDCEKTLKLFEQYRMEREKYLNQYESKYGPICVNSMKIGNTWDWIKSPWPWEGEK